MRKVIKLSLAVILASSTFVVADTTSEITSLTNTILNKLEMPSDSPDWMKRTSVKLQVEEDFKPTWELETVQPLHQYSIDDMIFWQLNATSRSNIETYNIGLGYRNILNQDLMLGVNSFYDYQQDYKHQRWSIGLEALNPRFEFRTNRYMAISGKKEVSTNVFQQALDGWDAEIGGKLIPDSNLKAYAKYTLWEGVTAEDLKQTSLRMEYPLNNSMDFELGYAKDNRKQGSLDQTRFYTQLSVTLGKKMASAKNLDTSMDLHNKLLIPVKRENEIVVERTISATITIGRASE